MKPRTKALTAAVTGTALGISGLALLAVPAGAGDDPELPEISPEELVESTLTAEPPAFAGTVGVDERIGLPEIPGSNLMNLDSARVWHDGDAGSRLAVERESAEQTIVHNSDGVWMYDSQENTATRYPAPEKTHGGEQGPPPGQMGADDPAGASTEIIDALRESSTITVDGTARVADRSAYELILTPKPEERTVLREVKIAVDAETRLPLRFEVLPAGSPEPVLSAGFTGIDFGEQPSDLFSFTPPDGARVVEGDAGEHAQRDDLPDPGAGLENLADASPVGDGWDTVLTGTLPEGALSGGAGAEGPPERGQEQAGPGPQGLLERSGERVSGDFGSGYVITTRAGTALVTDDGRFAVGAVPQQVVTEALEES
ncbi:Outer membrane lipoprotein-sorting protein [Haloechinothrix alba]|uniref:Outer membrane lipoprotein-sorting protein n=1 Tax=Haloechinothrix alba TaxID=664784 RepID=A0A238YSX6_9PSEU|nr:sigma-E factor regulatory protein RseB domain-containing protein [Haloechinothrix alba]SNR74150.1 Outer membrane lipoprotein-sorting protein [Haloechinothrix alba]